MQGLPVAEDTTVMQTEMKATAAAPVAKYRTKQARKIPATQHTTLEAH